MRFLRQLLGGGKPAAHQAAAPRPVRAFSELKPDEPLCLIGDLHGCADHLRRLLRLRAHQFPGARLVFLGDLIDRGPDSAGVLQLVREEVAKGAICIAGNHESMCLSFLEQPEKSLSWLKHGGLETVQSFGLDLTGGGPEQLRALRDAFRAALSAEGEAFLRELPDFWQSGNLVAVHAALDPQLPLAEQSTKVLQWGHPDFTRLLREDGLWVAHGHVIVPQAYAEGGRIALDTGAYATGRLSFALIDPALPRHERLTLALTP